MNPFRETVYINIYTDELVNVCNNVILSLTKICHKLNKIFYSFSISNLDFVTDFDCTLMRFIYTVYEIMRPHVEKMSILQKFLLMQVYILLSSAFR